MDSPEIDFILEATRFKLDEGEKAFLKVLSTQIDENAMLEISRAQRTDGIIHKALYTNGLSDVLSEKTLTLIRKKHIRNMVKNEKKFAFLKRLPDIIGDFVVLKGGQILQDVYDDTGIRLMDDLDIFVPADRAVATYHALKNFGFKDNEELSPGSYKSKRLIGLSIKHNIANHLPALNLDDIMIEIHCLLYGCDSERISHEAYKSSLPKSTEEQHVKYLSPEYNVVFLCKHFYNHGSHKKFYQLIDIREYISKYRNHIDWHKVDEIAETAKLGNAVPYTLNMLNQHFGLDIGNQYITGIQIDIEEMLRNEVRKNKREKVRNIFSNMKKPMVFAVVFLSEAFPSPKWLRRKYGRNAFVSYLKYLRNWFRN